MKITILNFSGRKDGNCSKISEVIQNELKEQDLNVINFNEVNIFPCSNCEYECFKEKEECPYIIDDCLDIYNKIVESDLVYYIVPNYCGYPCANFFIFNERGCCYFNRDKELLNKYININKKWIVVSNSNQNLFRNIFMHHGIMNPDILFLSSKEFVKKSIDGDIMDNEEARNRVVQFLQYMFA